MKKFLLNLTFTTLLLSVAYSECSANQFDCLGDGTECISISYLCDGSIDLCNAEWPSDCSNGADEGLDVCADEEGYIDACLSGADLSGADLSYADLSGADLSGANLTNANLSGADL